MGRRVDVLLLGVAAVWGSSYLSAKVLVVAGGVLAVLALRYLVSAAAMALVCVARRPPRPGRREAAVGIGLGVTQAAVLALETYGVSLTSATNAGLLISLTILLTPVLDGLVSRRWLPLGFFGAAAVALAGIALLISGSGLRAPSTGDALMLAAAVIRAVHVTASSRLTRTRPHDAVPMDTITLTLLQTIVGAVIFTAAGAPAVARAVTGFGPTQWLNVLYLALGCSMFAFLVQLWAVRRTSASRASLLLGTEPLWAVLIGLCLAGDVLGPAGAVGAVLVIAGTFWGQRVETRHRARLPATAGEDAAEVPSAGASTEPIGRTPQEATR
ncbi:DMT family transporter [Micromonospora deserti]|uniref:DMT family transporter n=1 Tax=Micromonospora deserti TaxID=2070366 RepID=UPI001F4776D8|nr:DMT family transporter [Micromonospora deserti]